jgi:hypothetical protein
MQVRSRVRPRRLLLGAALVALGAIVGSVSAMAVVIPTFDDVPADHPFFDEIEWMAATHISNGYPDGTYRPSDPVTRQAMSAFMQRLYDLQDDMSWAASGSVASTSSTTYSPIAGAGAGVIVPAGAFANIRATFDGESKCTGSAGSWCTVRLMISQDGGAYTEMTPAVGADFGFDAPGNADGAADDWESHGVTRMFEGSPGHVYTVRADFAVVGTATEFVDDWTLVVETDLQPSSFSPS